MEKEKEKFFLFCYFLPCVAS